MVDGAIYRTKMCSTLGHWSLQVMTMTKLESRGTQLIPWRTWRERISSSFVIFAFLALGTCLAFFTTFNYPISRTGSTCLLKTWGFWVPDGHGGHQGYVVANCLLPDGKLIQLSQPSSWTPPDVDSEISIEIVNYRLSGPAYFVK